MAKQIALKIYFLLSMLKTVVLAIFIETEYLNVYLNIYLNLQRLDWFHDVF